VSKTNPHTITLCLSGLLLFACIGLSPAIPPDLARDGTTQEPEVPEFTLPPLLRFEDGAQVKDAADWERRRQELLGLFEQWVYGPMPPDPTAWEVELRESGPAFDGTAVRKQIRLHYRKGTPEAHFIDLLLFIPVETKRPPVLLALNGRGNHTVSDDPAVFPPQNPAPTRDDRGSRISRFDVQGCLDKGVAVATLHVGDLAPDQPGIAFTEGIAPYYPEVWKGKEEFGAISVWAWGLSRALDYLLTDEEVDGNRVVVAGHSRRGKAALWAGARDARFAAVVSNNSGCNGAALTRRCFGETLWHIHQRFPHWFPASNARFIMQPDELPVDQHQLIACVAPRPIYIASASMDEWADPRGEYLALRAAEPAWELHGLPGLTAGEWPEPGTAVHGVMNYHVRAGKHGMTPFDWSHFADLANRLDPSFQ